MRPLGAPVADRRRARLALALALATLVAGLSYTGQRLGAWGLGEPTLAQGLGSLTVGYTWRLGLAVLHGAAAGCVAGLAVSEEAAARALGRLGPWAAAWFVACALALGLVP